MSRELSCFLDWFAGCLEGMPATADKGGCSWRLPERGSRWGPSRVSRIRSGMRRGHGGGAMATVILETAAWAQEHACGWVIRAARLNRNVLSADGRRLTLDALLREQPAHGTKPVEVLATTTTAARTATVALRFAPVSVPCPQVLTPWLRAHRSDAPRSMGVVELREIEPPSGRHRSAGCCSRPNR